MNLYVWVLLPAVLAAGAVTWWAIAAGAPEVEALARPIYFVLVLALTWLLHADLVGYGRWLLLAVALALVGDLFALGAARDTGGDTGDDSHGDLPSQYLAALVSFTLSSTALLLAVAGMPGGSLPLWVGVLLALATLGAVGYLGYRFLWPARPAPVLLLGATVAAPAATAVMSALAWWRGDPVVGVGTTLVLASISTTVLDRVGYPVPRARLAAMASLHLGILLIVLGMLR